MNSTTASQIIANIIEENYAGENLSEISERHMLSFSDNLDTITELRVAGSTPPKELAASIIHILNESRRVKLAAIGHQAVGQAVKAIPVVNQYCIAQGYLVAILPSFNLLNVTSRELPEGEKEEDAVERSGERTAERTVTVMHLVRITPQ
jgi:stage V sporulation protein SpoVS